MNGVLEKWLATLRYERQLAAQSIATYTRILESFFASHPQAVDASAAILQDWLNECRNKGLNPRTLSQHRSALRGFFGWLHHSGARADNPAAELRIPKTRCRELPTTFTPDDLHLLLIPPQEDKPLLCRDHAILETLYSTGLRLAEIVALQCADIRPDGGEVMICGKGGHERIVYFGSAARQALARWLTLRTQIAAADEPALFVNHRGGRLSARGLEKCLQRYAQTRLPGRRITPHMLRHSFASHLLQSSGDIRAVQELLGHRKLATTQIYTHLDYQHLSRVYDQAHPRAYRKKTSRQDNA